MKKIALVGSAPSSVRLAPYHNPDWEIWACSPGVYGIAPRTDKWFEIHRYEPGQPWFSPEYCNFLRQHPEVWVFDDRCDFENKHLIPHEYLVNKYGPYFFTSSLSWMFAMAIEAGATTIGLWGVDMSACCTPDTLVLTNDLEWIPVGELEIDDELIAFDEFSGKENNNIEDFRCWRKSKVTENRRIIRHCYRITFEDGSQVTASYDHKWLVNGGGERHWVETRNLVVKGTYKDGRASHVLKPFDPWQEDLSWNAGYLAAAFDGEGHVVNAKRNECNGSQFRVGFAQRDNPMSVAVQSACKSLGYDLGRSSKDGDCVKYNLRGGKTKTLEFLGRIRPKRLLENFDADNLGMMNGTRSMAVIAIEDIGPQEVVALATTTKTLITNGFCSHNTEEYGYQRAGCQHFAQLAKSMGIEVGIPPESDLLKPPPLYGLCEISHNWIKLTARQRELKARLASVQQEHANKSVEITFLQGALDDLAYIQNTYMGTQETANTIFTEPPLLGNANAGRDSESVQQSAPGAEGKPKKRRYRRHKGNGVDSESGTTDPSLL